MLKTGTLSITSLIVAVYLLAVMPGFIWPAYFDSPAGKLILVPLLSVYVLHRLGIPGLLEHDGLCGWGWCSPTFMGWTLVVVFWVLAILLVAWCTTALTERIRARFRSGSPPSRE